MKLSRVGIVGAGQLGRMLALAGYPLGIRFMFLDRSATAPAAQVAPILTGELEDAVQLAALASANEVVTFDWENIAGGALAPLEKLTLVRPPRAALEVSQDRMSEKALFSKLRIPVAAHAAVDDKDQLQRAIAKLGLPGVLKTRRLGYEGKGQFVLRGLAQIDEAWAAIGGRGLIYEKFQEFSREVSIVGARSASGETVFYPLSAKPMALKLQTTVNGQVTQSGNTADMIFSVPFLIEYFSSFMTLQHGDLILTGTPDGVVDCQPGDVVVTEIEHIGALINTIK